MISNFYAYEVVVIGVVKYLLGKCQNNNINISTNNNNNNNHNKVAW